MTRARCVRAFAAAACSVAAPCASALRMRALDALLTLRPRLFSGACAGEHAPSVARWHRPCGHGHEAGRRAG